MPAIELENRQPVYICTTFPQRGHLTGCMQACVNALAWAPHSSCHICTAGDDSQALIWDLSSMSPADAGLGEVWGLGPAMSAFAVKWSRDTVLRTASYRVRILRVYRMRIQVNARAVDIHSTVHNWHALMHA